MNLFSRIAIGTANWGREYNGARVSDDDQKRIMDYAQCSDIDTIETATAYGVDWTKWSSYFKKVVKIQPNEKIDTDGVYCVMAHTIHAYIPSGFVRQCEVLKGLSIYNPEEMVGIVAPDVIQVPYSLFDRRFEFYFPKMKRWHTHVQIYVRSIYLRGRILQDGISPQECLKFVLCNPFVDKIIIGADSFEQFRENVGFLHTWNEMEKHDIDLLDPRKWSDKKEQQ